jgi:triacylglycerol lipase
VISQRRGTGGGHIRALTREALALARQATLLHRDVASVAPTDGRDLIVLVHGFLATAGVLRPLRERLEADGHAVASFTHAPGLGVVELARRVGDVVKASRAERIQLVGHSIGGLAARLFVEELEGDPRVTQTVSIASPFWGTRRARLLPGQLGRDISPGSPLLERLRASVTHGVPHFAVSGTHDAVVGLAQPLGADGELIADGCGHNALLYDPRVLDAVAVRAAAATSRAPGAHSSL